MKQFSLNYLYALTIALLLQITNVFAVDQIVIIYNNLCEDSEMETDWGFAAWVERNDKVILFDSGMKGEILIKNMRDLNLDPERISQVIISHNHTDHLGGLKYFKQFLPENTKVYLPTQLSDQHMDDLKGLKTIVKKDYLEIEKGIWVTEVFQHPKNKIHEQSLVIIRPESFVLITGCAHPGIVEICENVIKKFPDKNPELVTGGTHLVQTSNDDVKQISIKIKNLGFDKFAPSHCTGEKAIELIKEDWNEDFLQLYLGDAYPL